jgi:hypothetical protein
MFRLVIMSFSSEFEIEVASGLILKWTSALFPRRREHNFALLLVSSQLRLALVEPHLSADMGVHGPHFGEEIFLAVTMEHQLVTIGWLR